MKKGTGVFKHIEEQKTVCDECGQDASGYNYIRWDAHYSDGWEIFGDSYDFCSIECAIKHSEKSKMMFPPETEDVTLEIPSAEIQKIIGILIDKKNNCTCELLSVMGGEMWRRDKNCPVHNSD